MCCKKFTRSALSLLVCSIAFSAGAEENKKEDETKRFDLGVMEVISVTGRAVSPLTDPIQPRVTQETMQQFNTTQVADAISLLPGVDIQNVGARSEQLIFVRGFNSRQVPLFVDGIPVYVPYDGNVDLSRFTTFDIAEVSVTKAYTSVLAGANTLGGSINVVTQKPQQGFQAEVGLGTEFDRDASRSGYNSHLLASLGRDLWYAQASISVSDRDYYKLPNRSGIDTPGEQRINSAVTDRKLSLRMGYTPTATDEYVLSYYKQEGDKNTPPYMGTDASVKPRYWQWPTYDKESLYFSAQQQLGSEFSLNVRAYYDQFDNVLESYDDTSFSSQNRPYAFTSVYDDYSWGLSSRLNLLHWQTHDIAAAIHYKVDVHREMDAIDIAPTERYEDRMLSLGIEDTFSWQDATQVIIGVSYDALEGQQADKETDDGLLSFELPSESAWNGHLAFIHSFSHQLEGRVSVAHRTRFPTIKDRYSYRFGSAIPNPHLMPEASNNIELGLSGLDTLTPNLAIDWGVSVFHSQLNDSIESVSLAPDACTSPPCSQLQNVGKSRISGVEGQVTFNWAQLWEYHLNYTYLDYDHVSQPQLKVRDIPTHSAMTYLSYNPFAALSITAKAQFNSDRNSDTLGQRIAPRFVTTQLTAAYAINDHWKLSAGVKNLGDKLYAYDEGFYESGRHYFMNVRWRY